MTEGIFEDSTENLWSDFSAPKREIQISGIYTTVDGALATFISSIDSIIDGTQDNSIVYHSDLLNANIDVFLMSWNYTYNNGAVSYLEYSMTLVEGKPL